MGASPALAHPGRGLSTHRDTNGPSSASCSRCQCKIAPRRPHTAAALDMSTAFCTFRMDGVLETNNKNSQSPSCCS